MYTVSDQKIYAMSKDNKPALTVHDGDIVIFSTSDCFDNQITDERQTIDQLDWDHINPATGPIFIEGATINDTLKVTILDIELNNVGTMVAIPDNGVLGKLVNQSEVKRVPIINGYAVFHEDLKVPCKPMIGVIGVAPQTGVIPCGTPGEHGGNMDNARITIGSSLYLPIFHEGALLAMGDVHAAMGDGEIMVSGIEIPAKITVKVEIVKGTVITSPMLEDGLNCYTIASHESLEEAIYQATLTMTEILMNKLGLSFNEAGMLLSACGNLEICQVVDPKRTVRMAVPKSILPSLF